MRQAWLRRSYLLFLIVPMLLVLLCARVQAQPAAGKAKVDRLVMGLIEKYRDYWRPWINGTPDHMIQHDPAFEWLFEVSPDGQYKPWLAESWEMAQDGRSWRLKLQKGVQFQHGYGEFTAKDVVHNHALWCDDNVPGRKDPPFSGYRNGMCMAFILTCRAGIRPGRSASQKCTAMTPQPPSASWPKPAFPKVLRPKAGCFPSLERRSSSH